MPTIQSVAVKDVEVEKVESATRNLPSLDISAKRSSRSEYRSNLTLFPEGVKEPVTGDDAKNLASIDPLSLGVVITQSPKDRAIYVDGVRVKRGGVVQGGLRILEFGPTYFVLEDSSGAKRRIELTDRLTVNVKEHKAEVNK